MVSPAKLACYFFQIAGMLVMFYGFAQQTGLISAQGGAAVALSSRIFSIADWAAAGTTLILTGFGIRAFFSRRPGNVRDLENTPLGLLRRRDKP